MIKVNVEIQNKLWNKKNSNFKGYLHKKIKKIPKIIKFFKKKNTTFTLLLTNSSNMKKLNKKFRNINKTTDVLSFPFFLERDLKITKQKNIYIGDIALSYEIIKVRSIKSNFLLEFDKAWVHGLLHLLGYDHIKNKDYFKMIKVEKKIFNLIN